MLEDAGAVETQRKLTLFCIPVFDDWESVLLVLAELRSVLSSLDGPVGVLLIDDGSTAPPPRQQLEQLAGFATIDILSLRRNVGHQRAIALGLAYIHRHRPCRVVVVMDGDGEDGPGDVPLLLERCRETGYAAIVFAKRTRRSEGPLFLVGYHGFRAVHYLLTGLRVEVGNFSAIPHALLDRIVGISEMWNHYAAAVIHARLPIEKVPIPRRRRRLGATKMNITDLVIHGLSAISVYGAQIGVRLLGLVSALMFVATATVLGFFGARWAAAAPIPAWAMTGAGFLVVGLLNLLLLSMIFVLFVLQSRNNSLFLPIRDWEHFIARVTVLLPCGREPAGGVSPNKAP
jgi:hypothetical protein